MYTVENMQSRSYLSLTNSLTNSLLNAFPTTHPSTKQLQCINVTHPVDATFPLFVLCILILALRNLALGT